MSEGLRASFELGSMGAMMPLLRRVPRGDGHHVLVLPGFMASDNSTRALRWYLRELGYHAHGWRLGVNIGPTNRILDGMEHRVTSLHRRSGGTVSVIGWSLGGIYARELARTCEPSVRQVITLGSPFALEDREASNAGGLYNMLSTFHSQRADDYGSPEHSRAHIGVPTTAIYTKGDGIVPWRSCIDEPREQAENVRVIGSHSGLGHNPRTLFVIADRLAQRVGEWQPYSARHRRDHARPRRVRSAAR